MNMNRLTTSSEAAPQRYRMEFSLRKGTGEYVDCGLCGGMKTGTADEIRAVARELIAGNEPGTHTYLFIERK